MTLLYSSIDYLIMVLIFVYSLSGMKGSSWAPVAVTRTMLCMSRTFRLSALQPEHLRSLSLAEHLSALHCGTLIPITWFYLHCHVRFLQVNESSIKVVANGILPSVSWGNLLRSRSPGKLLWQNWNSHILWKPFFRIILLQKKLGKC